MLNEDLPLEYKKTLEIINKQKNIIMKKIEDNNDTSEKNTTYVEQLIKLVENIIEYVTKIQNIEMQKKNYKNTEKDLNNTQFTNYYNVKENKN